MPKMYVNATSMRLSRGRSTPISRAMGVAFLLYAEVSIPSPFPGPENNSGLRGPASVPDVAELPHL